MSTAKFRYALFHCFRRGVQTTELLVCFAGSRLHGGMPDQDKNQSTLCSSDVALSHSAMASSLVSVLLGSVIDMRYLVDVGEILASWANELPCIESPWPEQHPLYLSSYSSVLNYHAMY